MLKIDQSLRSFKKIVYGQTFVFIFVLKTFGIVLIENKVKKKIHLKGLEKKIFTLGLSNPYGASKIWLDMAKNLFFNFMLIYSCKA